MLQLYDLSHNKLEGLINYKELKIEREINIDETLSFFYPNLDAKYPLIQEEGYILTQLNEYLIKEIIVGLDWTQVICKVNLEDLKGNPVAHFETIAQSCTNAVNLALVGTGWTIGTCDVTNLRTTRKTNSSTYEILQEIQSTYGCEIDYDSINKKVYIYMSMGSDKGSYFSEQLNLVSLDVQRNSYNYITRLIPTGKNGLGIDTVNGGKVYVENYQYSNKIITAYWEDNRYILPQDLLDDSITRLAYLSKPYRSYKAGIIDLATVSIQYAILDYSLGDTITLMSKSTNTKEKQRIIKITDFPEEPEKNTCEIANKSLKLEDINIRFQGVSDVVDSVTTSDGNVDGSKVVDLNYAQIQNIHIVVADIQDMSVVTARIGTLEAGSATIVQLNATNATITTLTAATATITSLNASNARIGTLEATTASINTLLAGNIGANNIATGAITAGSGIIAALAIGDAQISTMNAGKITAGTVDTSLVTIQGANGRLKITGNRLQVFAGTTALYERVSVGDVNGDGTVYGLRVRGADGTTILLDESGVKREGITDGSINNAKIGGDANISGTKLDIASVVTTINNGTTTIQGSKIFVNNSTLDVQFNALNTTVTTQGTTITSQAGSITALNNSIVLKVDTTAYTTKMASLDGNITNINTSLSTQSSSISALQGTILLKVTQTDIDTSVNKIQVGTRNYLPDSSFEYGTYNSGYITGCSQTLPLGNRSSYSLCLTATSNIDRYKILTFTSLPVGSYMFSFDVKCDTASMAVYGSILVRAAGSTNYGTPVMPNPLPTVWTRITIPVNVTGTSTNMEIILRPLVQIGGAAIYYDNLKIESGNKATDWSPAPEDVQGQIDSATTRISTAETTITQHTNSIALKASQTDLTTTNNNLGGVTSRLTTAEASIVTQAGQIALKVTQTQVDTSIGAIMVGGKNLVMNSTFDRGTTGMQNWSIVTGGMSAIGNNLGSAPYGRTYIWMNNLTAVAKFVYSDVITLLPNTQYTASFYVCSDLSGNAATCTFFVLGQKAATIQTGYDYVHTSNNIVLTDWVKRTITFTTAADEVKCVIRLDNDGSTSGSVRFSSIKLEEGNSDSAWSPNPDEVQADTDAAQASANTAITNAATAQTQANLGVTNAAAANLLLTDIADDNKLTAVEKHETKREWDSIVSEVVKNDAQATTFIITTEKTSYDSAYSALNTYITPLLTTLSTTSVITGTVFRSTFKTYYDARTTLLNAIAAKAKTLADNAQTYANSIQVGGRNLLMNSDFNLGIASWASNGYTSLLSESTDLPIGAGSAGICVVPAANKAYYQVIAKTILGQVYSISLYAKASVAIGFNYGFEPYGYTNAILTTTWTKFTTTFIGNGATGAVVMYPQGACTFYLTNVKIEMGNKVSDWTPSPEDTQGQIDGAVTRISNSETTITQNKADIGLTVSTLTTNLANNYSSTAAMNTAIAMSASSITSSVSATYATINTVNGKVDTANFSSLITQNATSVQTAFNGATGLYTIKNGKLQIQNSAGTNVMWVDTNGLLNTDRLVVTGADNNVLITGTGHKGLDLLSTNNGDCYIQFQCGTVWSRIQATSTYPGDLVYRTNNGAGGGTNHFDGHIVMNGNMTIVGNFGCNGAATQPYGWINGLIMRSLTVGTFTSEDMWQLNSVCTVVQQMYTKLSNMGLFGVTTAV